MKQPISVRVIAGFSESYLVLKVLAMDFFIYSNEIIMQNHTFFKVLEDALMQLNI